MDTIKKAQEIIKEHNLTQADIEQIQLYCNYLNVIKECRMYEHCSQETAEKVGKYLIYRRCFDTELNYWENYDAAIEYLEELEEEE